MEWAEIESTRVIIIAIIWSCGEREGRCVADVWAIIQNITNHNGHDGHEESGHGGVAGDVGNE